MRITALVENTAASDCVGCEHGLSLYIETENRKILFDMGQSDLFLHNAQQLGLDIAAVDTAVLSHGHYDHGGGLSAFWNANKNAPVYISRYAFEQHYNGTEKYIGLDVALKDNEHIVFTDGVYPIADGLTLYHTHDRVKPFDLGSFGLNLVENDVFVPDDFRHEQCLLIEKNGKRVLISGCSHQGVLNAVTWFHPDVLVGGFHFSKLPLDDTLADYAAYLNRFDTVYYTGHCTGEEQYRFMKERMERLNYLAAGESIVI